MKLMKWWISAVLLAAALWQTGLAMAASMQVSSVGKDLTLSNVRGEQVRFRDVVFPDPERAKHWLEAHALHRDFAFTDQGKDRYGATLVTSTLEEDMLADGVAMLHSQGETPKAWSNAEKAARDGKKGLWSQKDFVLTPENAGEYTQQYRAVEGVVKKVHVGKDSTYINFGDDWKTDFSAQVRGRDRKALAATLGQLAPGNKVQIRGTIYSENGPMVKLTRPDQLSILTRDKLPEAPTSTPDTNPVPGKQ